MYTLDSKGLPIPASISSQFKSPSTSSLNSTHTPTIENYTPQSSSTNNKIILYIALFITILVALGGGYLIYSHYSKSKTTESFGYRL